MRGETYQVRYRVSAFAIFSSIMVHFGKKSGDTGE